ncbi:MAG: SDR family oxidoreductase [Porticoccus sp.]|nr:SDR family oxidoreductase [Porticoccus sp.]
MKLNGSTILLTGASGGIGAAVAKALDQQGAQLLLVGRNEPALKTLKQQLSGKHLIVLADINTQEGREQIVQQCTQCNGIDLMINLAGILDFGFFEQQSDHCIEQTLTTNLVSPMLLCHRLIPILKQREEAAIVNVGSTFGSIGHPGFTTYCASKFGLRGFTEALRRELADTSIRVLYLAPRATDTRLNSDAVTALNSALGNKTDSPEQVANELISLVSSNQHQRYMGWPEKLFVWLNALFPSLVHGALIKKIPIIRQFSK